MRDDGSRHPNLGADRAHAGASMGWLVRKRLAPQPRATNDLRPATPGTLTPRRHRADPLPQPHENACESERQELVACHSLLAGSYRR